jgi:hypothetical protein
LSSDPPTIIRHSKTAMILTVIFLQPVHGRKSVLLAVKPFCLRSHCVRLTQARKGVSSCVFDARNTMQDSLRQEHIDVRQNGNRHRRPRKRYFGTYLAREPTSRAQVSAVIGPTTGMVISCCTRSTKRASRSSERTLALSVFCKRTTVSRHSRSSEISPSSISGLSPAARGSSRLWAAAVCCSSPQLPSATH